MGWFSCCRRRATKSKLLCSVPVTVIDEPLKEQELAKISRNILEWQVKGSLFGLTEGEIEDIKEDNNSNSLQKVAMLRMWAKKNGGRVTLRLLIETACNSGCDAFAKKAIESLGYSHNDKGWFKASNAAILLLGFIFFVLIISWNTSALKPLRIQVWKPFSPAFPNKEIVGRSYDLSLILNWIDFSNKKVSIVNIVGPPRIGKSALAIYAGNEIMSNGVRVYYLNMEEFSGERLKEDFSSKILSLSQYESKGYATAFEQLKRWSNARWLNHMILLDNCENCIQKQRDQFYEVIEELLKYSNNKIKIVTTSRSTPMHLEHYKMHKIGPLDEKSACMLLESKVPLLLNLTEKRAISELTGEVPLALQIIGSLLNFGVKPPTPAQIIASLKSNPIPTLSPISLQRNMQLNASISLSYDYLDKTTQRIGRYLALFPGSFDKNAVIGVLSLTSAIVRENEYYLNAVNDLIARSLLELDTSSDRYVYHKLIKSYFFTHTKLSQQKKFNTAFQVYFAEKLNQWINQYAIHPKRAIVKMDVEQHNIYEFIVSLQNVTYSSHDDYTTIILSFTEAFASGYLQLKFSPRKLTKYVNKVIDNLELFLITQKRANLLFFFEIYIGLIIRLSKSMLRYEDNQLAFNVYKKRVNFIERIKQLDGTSKGYSDFYSHFLKFAKHMDRELMMLYNARLLQSVTKKMIECGVSETNTTCSNIRMASGYFSVGDYENSMNFYEKALENGEMNDFRSIFSVKALHKLYIAHQNLTKAQEVETKLVVELFNDARSQPSSVVYSYISLYTDYLKILDSLGESEKAIAIHETILDALNELGEKQVSVISLQRLYEIAKNLLKLKEYERVVKFASHGLQRIQNISSNLYEFIGFSVWKGKATYLAGNFSNATDLFVRLMEFLIAENFTESYASDYLEVCYYLTRLNKFDYILDCYFRDVSIYFKKLFYGLAYTIFIVPYGIVIPTNVTEIFENAPIEKYPPITEQSKKTDLIFDQFMSLAHMPNSSRNFYSVGSYITLYVTKVFNILQSYNLFRFVVNFHLIYYRLEILYYLCIILFKCCRKLYNTFIFLLSIIYYTFVVISILFYMSCFL